MGGNETLFWYSLTVIIKKIGVEENFKPMSKMKLGLYVDFIYSCAALSKLQLCSSLKLQFILCISQDAFGCKF